MAERNGGCTRAERHAANADGRREQRGRPFPAARARRRDGDSSVLGRPTNLVSAPIIEASSIEEFWSLIPDHSKTESVSPLFALSQSLRCIWRLVPRRTDSLPRLISLYPPPFLLPRPRQDVFPTYDELVKINSGAWRASLELLPPESRSVP